jgi:SGNH hydrolase-like domain, acetyltransferase AlgX
MLDLDWSRPDRSPRVPYDRPMSGSLINVLGAVLVLSFGCAQAGGVRFPWPAIDEPTAPRSAPDHAEVTTINKNYRRDKARVLVRRISRATRANLDYAAYHANFMNTDPPPEHGAGSGQRPDASHPFGGALEESTLTGSLRATALTPAERARPFAFAPLVELLTSKKVPGGEVLEDVAGRVRSESWGLGGGPQLARQVAALAYLHEPGGNRAAEVWIKVEFAPWFQDFAGLPDPDGDGVGEIFGRVPPKSLGAGAADLARFIRDDYAARLLSASEVKAWAHQLASYWYPSYNTDLVNPPSEWPDSETEPDVVRELAGQRFVAPAVVMRGKPQGTPVYNVFLVDGVGPSRPATAAQETLTLPRTRPTPDPAPVMQAIREELAAHGGSWATWKREVSPLHEQLRKKLSAIPAGAKATAGADGYLFFGQSIAYVIGGDLGKQRHGRNPVPVIVQWAKLLADQGVDLLFVPIPTKEEIFPDKLASSAATGKVVNPFERKFLLDLGEKGVEVVDLLPTFLRERTNDPKDAAPIFQAQDTHWSDRGLEIAARVVAARVKRYPWYKQIASHRKTYGTKPATFTRHGDLHSRLPESDKPKYAPETLVGKQVVASDGTPYDDDPGSPIVVLGDSFTGVYQLMDCEHAGVSAHLAKELGYPVDLVMSYGGGPNVRQKLLRRGVAALATKKLVIWMMTARDLHEFWEGWQPVDSK